MSLHGLAYTVLLAVPALAAPRPNAHRSLSARQLTETSLPVITQTSTETSAYTRPTCTKTVYYNPDDTCDDMATPFQFQLGIAEGCLSAKSQHCKDLLSIYRICLSPADNLPDTTVASSTASSRGSSTSDSVFATMTPSPNASVVVNLETRTSWTTTTTQTTVYYMVGEGTSTSLQSVVVDYTSTEEVTPTTTSSSLASSTGASTTAATSSSSASSTEDFIFGIEHGRSYLYGYKLIFRSEHGGSYSCGYKLNFGIEHSQPDLDLSRACRVKCVDFELRVAGSYHHFVAGLYSHSLFCNRRSDAESEHVRYRPASRGYSGRHRL
ncbi:hypothetical protein KC346_g16770 [Hortaea werneckii]|nr:hypothetical protein KC346_g16770 [Hortaea werneckii]